MEPDRDICLCSLNRPCDCFLPILPSSEVEARANPQSWPVLREVQIQALRQLDGPSSLQRVLGAALSFP